jgi:hypothetical protein
LKYFCNSEFEVKNTRLINFSLKKEKKKSTDIGLLLKNCEKLTDLNDLLNTVVSDNTKEAISNLVESISKTTASIEAASSPKPIEVGCVFSILMFIINEIFFLFIGKQISIRKRIVASEKERIS